MLGRRFVGSKRGSRDLRAAEGAMMVRFRGTACRVERVCGACLEVRWWEGLKNLVGRNGVGVSSSFGVEFEVAGSVSTVCFRFPGRRGGANDSCALARAPKLMSLREDVGSSSSSSGISGCVGMSSL